MRNFTKILCVVLALVVALSAASCSLTKEYSYKDDNGELPIGLYIYYLQTAYNEAQSLAQKDTEKYDSAKGTYDGSKSFLKMEITDDDGNTAVAEDWIINKAAEYMDNAIAIYTEYNRLGCTMDEAQLSSYKTSYKEYWDNGIQNYYAPFKDSSEPYGIGFEAFFLAEIELRMMQNSVFQAEYKDVADEELHKFYEENYTSYHYFSIDLYTETTDENSNTTYDPVSDAQKAAYIAAFDGYAEEINSGEATFSEQFEVFKEEYNSDATATEKKEKLDSDTDLNKAILALKDGEAKQVTIEDESKKTGAVYLIYKDAIADTTETYFADDVRDSVLSVMKEDDFKALLKKVTESTDGMSSACKNYKPSMFES